MRKKLNLIRKKLNLIALTDLISRALAMHNIRVITKLSSVTHQVEPDEAWWHNSSSRT